MHYNIIAPSAYYEETIPPFAKLIRRIEIQDHRLKKMLSITARIPKKRGGSLQPVLPLIPERLPTKEDDKAAFLSFELKMQSDQAENGTKYKKSVRKFEEGTPQQWVDLVKDLREIWRQNGIEEGSDRVATIRSLIKGESGTAFETALEDATTTESGEEQQVTKENVETALKAVATTVFPHRALEMQKLWMNRRMFKPAELTTRQTSAAINRLNNSLPLFPGGSDNSKFTEKEIIELLEWSLPPTWRAKFDLDGYIPTLDTKSRLIEACEAIERNEAIAETDNNKKGKKGKGEKPKNENSGSAQTKGEGKKKKFFCTEHGSNPTHSTSDCWTLKNRASKNDGSGGASTTPPTRSFTNKGFRKEVNLLARSSSKKKVLDLYATAVQREQSKLAKKQANKRKKSQTEGESEDDMSVELIEPPLQVRKTVKFSNFKLGDSSNRNSSKTNAVATSTTVNGPEASAKRIAKMREQLKLAKRKANSSTTVDTTLEEEAYQRRVEWLRDRGESNDEESPEEGEESSGEEQTDN